MTSAIKRVIVIVNTIGFVAYLVWLMQFTTGETMRSQDGILYYIPCLPFLFVYMLLAPPKPASKEHPDASGNSPAPAAPADKDTSEASKP